MKRQPHQAQDHGAELALCGAVLVDEGILDAVNIEPEHFFDPRLRRLWGHMQGLRSRGIPLDDVTLLDGAPAGVDLTVIAEVAAGAGSSRNAEHYAETVRRHALTRQVLLALSSVMAKHEAGMAEGKDLLDEALATITRIDVGRPGTTLAIGDLVRRRMKQLDALTAARANGISLGGVPTGSAMLDAETDGWPIGLVSIVAARPGMGKSAFLLAATEAATRAKYGAHVFSVEDSAEVYTDRALSQESGVPGADIRGQLKRLQLENLSLGAKRLVERKNWLYEDVSSVSAEDIVRAVRRKRVENNTKLVVVDYLQLVRRPKRYESIHDAIFQVLVILADAARQDGIAYVVASQLNREVEKRQDKRPKLSDLRDSGSIEERAKLIIGLYRGSYYGDPQKGVDYDPSSSDPRERYQPDENEWRRRLDVYLLKHSQGEANNYVRCNFDGPTMRITQERDP
jgi:replicative DNA helicase